MTTYLNLEDLLQLTRDLQVGPVRDLGLLDSAVHRPQAHVFGLDAYPDIHTKAAVLVDSIVGNHALVDGNKRLGFLAVVVFYGLNGRTIDAPDDEAVDVVMRVAAGELAPADVVPYLTAWCGRT